MFNRIRTIRKRWLVAFTAAALLAVGLVSGAAFAADARADYVASALSTGDGYAQGNARHGRGNSDTLYTRVAEILGIEKSTLDSAFETAVDEQAETRFDAKVAELVADETLTEDQGDAATDWFEDRPALSGPIAIRLAGASDSDKVDESLATMVEKEKLTQDESDALSDWHDDRPDSLPEVEHNHRKHRGNDNDGDSQTDGDGNSA